MDNRRVFLIYGGESDETVSQQSSSLVRSTFGYQSVEEHVYSSGHWVFAGNGRDLVKELVLNFVQGKK